MQGQGGSIHVAYSFGDRQCVKYACLDEHWICGEKMSSGAEDDPSMPCRR